MIAAECFCQQDNISTTNQIAETEKQNFNYQIHSKQPSLASNNFKIYYARCEWNIDPSVRYISGSVTSYFKILTSTDSIRYDLTQQLTVDSIIFRKKKISFSQNSNSTLTIFFQLNIAAQKRDSVTIFYHGVPAVSGDFTGGFVQSAHNGTPIIWTLSEPYGAAGWWPCRNGLDDKIDSIDIYVTHPSQYKTSSNGLLISAVTTGTTTTTHYKHRYPIATYLIAFAVTNYSTFTNNVSINGTTFPVIQYIYPENLASFQNAANIVLNALQLYSNNFGIYPFNKERYGQTQFGFSGGMEHQTNSFVYNSGTNLMTHELAHQWFGDKVTCGSWQDIWLNEGFATWIADMFYTEKFDTATYRTNVSTDLNNVVSQPGGSVWVNDTTNSNRIFDSRLTYRKGAFLLRMLRYTLGDTVFFKALNNYLNDPKLSYGFARTIDLQRHLENTSGKNLDYFFNQWFYGEGYPSFTVKWYQDGFNKLHFFVQQQTSVPSTVNFFKVLLPVQITNGSITKTVQLNCKENNEVFIINDPGFKVSSIIIDPDKYIISKNDSSIHSFFIYPKLIATPVPVDHSIILLKPNPVTNAATVTIKNASGKIILELYNNNANLMWSKSVNINNQSFTTVIPFASFNAGLYRLVVKSEKDELGTITIVK